MVHLLSVFVGALGVLVLVRLWERRVRDPYFLQMCVSLAVSAAVLEAI